MSSLAAGAEVAGNTAYRAHSHGMIAAEDERQESGGEGFVHAAGQCFAGAGDQRQVLGTRIALGPGFLLFDGYVAAVLHLVAERSHAGVQVGDANGGRAHIDAAAVLPEIERRADDGDVGPSAVRVANL